MIYLLILAFMVCVWGTILFIALMFLEYRDHRRAQRDPEAQHDEHFSLEAAFVFAWAAVESAVRKFLHWIRRLV